MLKIGKKRKSKYLLKHAAELHRSAVDVLADIGANPVPAIADILRKARKNPYSRIHADDLDRMHTNLDYPPLASDAKKLAAELKKWRTVNPKAESWDQELVPKRRVLLKPRPRVSKTRPRPSRK